MYAMFDFLTTPEHIHLIISHIPIVGLAAAALVLIYSFILKDTEALFLGFILCAIFAGSMYFVMQTGEEAHDRFEELPLSAVIGAEGDEWMGEHHDRAESGSTVIYITGGLALLGILSVAAVQRFKFHVGVLTLILIMGSLGVSLWIANAGRKINHPEFRSSFSWRAVPPSEKIPTDQAPQEKTEKTSEEEGEETGNNNGHTHEH
ncbi:MAG: hypothetical protein V3U74_04930 [Thermodesulfobacteriota bacterium]